MYETLLILHFLALAAGIGMSVTIAVQGAVAARLPAADAAQFMAVATRATIIAPVAVVVVIASGLGLVWELGVAPSEMGAGFWIKMASVAVLALCVAGAGYSGKKAGAEPDGPYQTRAAAFGKGALAASVLAVIAAVIAFH